MVMSGSCSQSFEIECGAQQHQTETKTEQEKRSDSSILYEILIRLPVKSLVRFKCVCKRWRFLVEKDSYFIDLHLKQSIKHPNLLFVASTPEEKPSSSTIRSYLGSDPVTHKLPYKKVKLVTVDLIPEGRGRAASFDTITKIEFPCKSTVFFGPVNGLIGCHSIQKKCICIYNISTQEISPWIESKLPGNMEDEDGKGGIEGIPCYEMGFDPATKKHKVICIQRKSFSATFEHDPATSYYGFLCGVLTVGDNKWRRIKNVPSFNFDLSLESTQRKHTVHLNGFIYYCTSTFMQAGELGNDQIVVFDIGAERFSMITVPNFILDQPRCVPINGRSPMRMIELEGRLSLLIKMSYYTVKLWVFDGVHEKNENTSSSHQNWTELVNVGLPYLWDDHRVDVCFYSVVGTDQIVIESYGLNSRFGLHLNSWKTNSCKEIDIRGFKYYPSYARVSATVESLLPVQ